MKKIIVIAGVTASGKTTLGVELAKAHNGEIINADSVSIYKDLNIGSAKPSIVEQDGIKHHLLDILEISENYSAADFQKDARSLIDDIISRGKKPIIVGGTGLYINAVIYDYHFEEKELVEIDNNLSNQELKDILEKADPESYKSIHVNNRKRLIRAVQIAKTFGKSKAEVNRSNKKTRLYNAKVFFLEGDRQELYKRINQRVDEMFQNGLVDEVESLLKKNPELFSYKSINSIGYQEFKEYFPGNITLIELQDLIKRNTRRLAKRQITWFKHQTKSEWIDIFDKYHVERIQKEVKFFLNQ